MDSTAGKKRIAFFLGSMGSGGAERVISILSRHYAAKGYATDIGVLLFYEQFYELHPTTRFLDFTRGGGSRWKRVPFWLRSIRRYVRREKPDVIISFAARINILVQLACLGLKVRLIVSERSDPRYDYRGKVGDILTKALYPHSYKVIFQTKRALDYFPKAVRKKGCIIFNPISVSALAAPEKKKKVVTVGRLSSEKNTAMLIEAFSDVLRAHLDYQLWVYGEGELRPALEAQIRESCLDGKVFLPGITKDIHEQIRDAELFVLSSDFEGMSNALMEAMMMGLTVVSTDCAGADEVIEDHVNGLLTPVGDKDALAKAMLYCIEHPVEAKMFGKNAARSSAAFSVDAIFEQWDRLVEELPGGYGG